MQSFSELPLSEPVSRAIAELGFETPSPIQAETLPLLLGASTDFMGLAATGTGKTAAFAIPMLERLGDRPGKVEALILCPTRELALQVCEQVSLLGKYKGVQPVPIYGGASYHDQIYGIKRGAQVVVGTPGRINDHIQRGTLKLDSLKTLILDEADEMISMGFKEELDKILGAAPRSTITSGDTDNAEDCRIWLFSATMSREVRRVADTYLRSPKFVQINRTEMVPATIEQYYYPAREGDKAEILCKLIEASDDFYGLIFCQTKALVVDLTQYLHERGYRVDSLHGDKDQNSRERTMQSFRDRKVRMLVCTDVASRGLDVKDITHVINYSLPRELDNYVHRIGRTGRSGKAGIAMNLVTLSHRRLIYQIEKLTKTRMLEGQIPGRREIAAKKVDKLLAKFSEQPNFTRATEVMSEEWKTAVAAMEPTEIASRFLSMMMPETFSNPAEKARAARPEVTASASKLVLPPIPRSPGPRAGGGSSYQNTRPASRPGAGFGPAASSYSSSRPQASGGGGGYSSDSAAAAVSTPRPARSTNPQVSSPFAVSRPKTSIETPTPRPRPMKAAPPLEKRTAANDAKSDRASSEEPLLNRKARRALKFAQNGEPHADQRSVGG